MPLDPQKYLTICDQSFTQVIDEEGSLLGCVPTAWAEPPSQLFDQDGKAHDFMFGLIAAVVCDLKLGEDPRRLHDFTPVEGLDQLIKRKLSPPAPIPGNSRDIGRE